MTISAAVGDISRKTRSFPAIGCDYEVWQVASLVDLGAWCTAVRQFLDMESGAIVSSDKREKAIPTG